MMGVGAQDPPALSKHMDGSAALIFASGSTDRAMYTPENGKNVLSILISLWRYGSCDVRALSAS